MSIKKLSGNLDSKAIRTGIVVSRFNSLFTDKLLEGAIDCLVRHGSTEAKITAAYVPGAFELPYVGQKMVQTGKYDLILCLGAIIRGDTPHFDYIANEASKGIAKLAMESGVPVIYGLVTADTLEQAMERSGTKAGNKGWQAAEAGIEMVNLYKVIG